MTDVAQHDGFAEVEQGDLPKFDQLLNEGRRQLSSGDLNLPCHFTFSWSGIGFTACVDKVKDAERRCLQVGCDVGALPYSAEDPLARVRILSLVGWHDLEAPCRFAIGPRGRVHCFGVIELDDAPDDDTIVVALTKHLLAIKPYLVLAGERIARHADYDAIRAER